MTTWKVLIAHAVGEDRFAELLAAPLRTAGYEVAHSGTVLVGESVVEEASRILQLGGPVVLCGTVRAMGTSWARKLVNAARRHLGVRVFVVQMEADADVDSAGFDEKVARYWQDPAKALADLQSALCHYYPPNEVPIRAYRNTTGQARYCDLLQRNCDIIDLANLPEQDRHLARRQFELRSLYVPLRVWVEKDAGEEPTKQTWDELEHHRKDAWGQAPAAEQQRSRLLAEGDSLHRERFRASIGERLGPAKRLVVLGEPGAGKTTLARWITTAYLLRLQHHPDWVNLPDVTSLPDADWLPVLVRCRDLDDESVRGSLEDILQHSLRKAELTDEEAVSFHAELRDRLDAGTVLLIVDGLDEIGDQTLRARFCQELQQIQRAYRHLPMLITSRIVGYREMGYELGKEFEHVTIADLSREEKDSFARRWCHLTERPDREAASAEGLIHDIHSSDRIERLTGNPMLLTTLALVKRKVGKLPNRRADLYWEAVQVLLNWRSEVDEPLDAHEAVPQLSYLAYAMCDRGIQQLRRDEAIELLAQMRREYPSLHLIHRQPPEAFLRQAERRTGILLEAGRTYHLGMNVPVYEFRHLTFQEYLAARALVDGIFPGRRPGQSLAEHVSPLAGRVAEIASEYSVRHEAAVVESWREALRLCTTICHNDDVDSVLRGIFESRSDEPHDSAHARAVMGILCLADEPNASDGLAEAVFRAFAREVQTGDGHSGYRRSLAFNAAASVADTHWSTLLQQVLIEEYIRRAPKDRNDVSAIAGMIGARRLSANAEDLARWLSEHAAGHGAIPDTEQLLDTITIDALARRDKILDPAACVNMLLGELSASEPRAQAAAGAMELIVDWSNKEPELRAPDSIPWIPTTAYVEGLLVATGLSQLNPPARCALIRILGTLQNADAFELLVNCLGATDSDVREAAADSLGKLGLDRAIEPLVACLEDSESQVRRAAVVALASIGSERTLAPLTALLPDLDLQVRSAAVRALGHLGHSRVVASILALTGDDDDGVRASVADALGNIGSIVAVEGLAALLADKSEEVQREAALSLGQIGSEAAISALLQHPRLDDGTISPAVKAGLEMLTRSDELAQVLPLLRDGCPDVRESAADLLEDNSYSGWVPVLLAELGDESSGVRQAVVRALANKPDARSLDALEARLDDKDEDVRKAVVLALGQLGGQHQAALIVGKLADGDTAFQETVAQALGSTRSEAAVEHLVPLLRSETHSVQTAAARALGSLLSDRAVDVLISHLPEADARLRTSVIESLGDSQSVNSLSSLLSCLDDGSATVRRKAALALGKLGSDESVQRLLTMLDDQSNEVRQAAVTALGEIGAEEAVPPLTARLDSASTAVKSLACEALGKIGSPSAVEPLVASIEDPSEDVSHAALVALGRIGTDRALDCLTECLGGSKKGMARTAAYALQGRGSQHLTEPLSTCLQSDDIALRLEAVLALAHCPPEQSVRCLSLASRDAEPLIRSCAAFALGITGSGLAVAPLAALLADSEFSVRSYAILALGEVGTAETIDLLLKAAGEGSSILQSLAIHALGRVQSDLSTAFLIDGLQAQSDVRHVAAWSLGWVGNEEAVNSLLPVLQDEDPDMRDAAAWSLGRIGSTRAVKQLSGVLGDRNNDVRAGAAIALGMICEMQQDFKAAAQFYDRSCSEKPNAAPAHRQAADMHRRLGNLDVAARELRYSLVIDPENMAPYTSMAGLMQQLGQSSNAERLLRASRGRSRQADLYDRACVEALSGNAEAAMALLRRESGKPRWNGMRRIAAMDLDFTSLRGNQDFAALVL